MPDISMCKGGNCGIKKLCYRFTEEPNEYGQIYFTEPPYKEKMDGTACEYYIPIRYDTLEETYD